MNGIWVCFHFFFYCRRDSRGVSRSIFSIHCNHDLTVSVEHCKYTQMTWTMSAIILSTISHGCVGEISKRGKISEVLPQSPVNRAWRVWCCLATGFTDCQQDYSSHENGIWLTLPPGEQELNEPSHFFLIIQRDYQMMLTKFL